GSTSSPVASSSRAARTSGAISTTRPSAIPTSAARGGAPVPSTTVPPRIATSKLTHEPYRDAFLSRACAAQKRTSPSAVAVAELVEDVAEVEIEVAVLLERGNEVLDVEVPDRHVALGRLLGRLGERFRPLGLR